MDRRVRARRRQVNRARGRKRAGLIFVVALVVVAATAFIWLRSSSVFAVETVTASVTHHVTREQIADAVASSRGVSLFKVSTGAVESSLAALPYARAVHVYRRFPDGLHVRIQEYEPAARVQYGNGRPWLVADDGRVLEEVTGSASSRLPLIVGSGGLQLLPGGHVPQSVLAVLPVAVILESPELAGSLTDLEHISVSGGGDVVVHLEGGTELRLGEPVDLKQKIMAAASVIQEYLRDGKALEYVDASAGGRLAVKPK